MAQSSFPFENIDTTETQYSQMFRTLNNGVNGTPDGGELEVDAAPAGLAVEVAAGQSMVRGHFYISTDAEERALAVADSVNDRIDTIVLRLDPLANNVLLAVKTGTPDPAPVAPALVQTDGGVFEQPLANVLVPANAGVPSTITDRREFMGTKLGTWTTAGRPVPAGRVLFGYNSTLEYVEYYDPIAEDWEPVAPPINELNDIGDVDITTPADGDLLVYDDGDWVNKAPIVTAEFLVVAGAGGGGSGGDGRGAGGGGAGGYFASVNVETSGANSFARQPLIVDLGTAYSVVVGAGGAGGVGSNNGSDGSNSTFDTVTATGGGGGGRAIDNGRSGGSGGGAGDSFTNTTGGAGTTLQGSNGGNVSASGGSGGAGGGGASAVGANGTGGGGAGGAGLASVISGASVTRAVGGQGGAVNGGAGDNGAVNTGNGARGGGGFGLGAAGGAGGSGIVIIRLPFTVTATFSSGVTSSVANVGPYKVYTVTATSTTSETVTIS
jgi:hypothetical protein